MIEQKKFYSISYSEHNIRETHKTKTKQTKKQQQKVQIKIGGTKKKKAQHCCI